ncbi:hypothetical protein ACFVWZ_17220 [Streptomyces sp. NPDC058200]|uniref:hypothetical protein n=1 Tax=Streptomyces sp. NPDC058200 TaxID=3346378 RepID=UPI0036F10031
MSLTEIAMARQPGGGDSQAQGRAPVEPAASEACRLLCAGVHLDGGYRDAVLDELYLHEERFVAPSTGIDAARVLAHALRARRTELGWAVGMLALWISAVPLTSGLFLLLVPPCVLLALAPWITGRSPRAPWYRKAAGFLVLWYGRFLLAGVLVSLVLLGFSGEDPPSEVELVSEGGSLLPGLSGGLDSLAEPGRAWAALILFLLIMVGVGLRRGQFARVMTNELSARRFPEVSSDPAELASGARYQRLRARIRAEQHAPLVMYHSANPFRGVGEPFRPWTLAVELRPRKDRKPVPVDNGEILRRIVPLLEALRVPSPHGSPEAADAVRDRLRELRVDECVFLPVDGLTRRDGAPYDDASFGPHRDGSVEEGGEARRHFLRIRVGGWHEELVVTVFVRVHTQGGMLMLEVAPHVLMPVRPQFREADRVAHRYLNNSFIGKAAWALAHAPESMGQALLALVRYLVSAWELLTGGQAGALPDGPAVSVRELGSDSEASLFQEMDVSRYLKSVEDRVAGGVRLALYEAGWQTAEFEQKIVNVANGGVFIETAQDSAIGIGDHNSVSNRNEGAGSSNGRD